MNKNEFKILLREKTGCFIQHDGWPCRTCFFSVSEKLTNMDWQTVLLFRCDYESKDLNNIPKTIKGYESRLKRIEKIFKQS